MRSASVATSVLDAVQRVINIALTILILLCLALFAVGFFHAPAIATAWPVALLHRFGDPIANRLAALLHLPGARAYMPLVMALIVYLAIVVSDRICGAIYRVLHSARASAPKPAAQTAAPAQTGVESEQAREQLYKEYRKIEKALKEAKRKQCSFLSVDVVGSTTMKNGETDVAIKATFHAYEELLKRTFLATHAWKESWTPDGVMICFLNREDAVQAGKSILQQLLVFNQRDNALKTRFEVRCGANEGEVVVFDDSDLEKLVEHVIDVAGHMQKHATPGTLMLSKELYGLLEDSTGFAPTGKEVDGYQTYAWAPTPLSP